jgi:hypothetical protein
VGDFHLYIQRVLDHYLDLAALVRVKIHSHPLCRGLVILRLLTSGRLLL